MEFVYSILASAIALLIAAQFLSGVKVQGFVQAIIIVVVLGVLNITVGSVLKILSLGILSLGIFNWLLDAIIIQIADFFLDKFDVKNFWWALGLAALTSMIDSALHWIF